jgi:hypothetical protein
MGATAMEITYCFIAFTGFADYFTGGIVKLTMQLGSILFLIFLGAKFLKSKSVQPQVSLGIAAQKLEGQIKERLHPHSAFMIGYVRVMANLGVLVFWIVLAANFILWGWVTPDWPGKLACVAGVGVGTGLWFSALSWCVSLGHGKMSDRTLLKMEHGSGIGLLALAMFQTIILVWEMSHSGIRH